MPQSNVLYAYFAGLIALVVEHIATAYGYTTPPDIAAALPAAIAVGIAHLSDILEQPKPPK